MAPSGPGIRLLPNAITVLAMCAGLSAVHFAIIGMYGAAIGSIAAAATTCIRWFTTTSRNAPTGS